MTIPHLKERIEYAREELAWLEAGAKEGEEPWRGWDTWWTDKYGWQKLVKDPMWDDSNLYRRRPVMLHVIDAKGVRHEFPAPMREAPEIEAGYWFIDLAQDEAYSDKWDAMDMESLRLEVGLCQSTEEGAQQQLAALRAACLGGEV